MIAAFGGLPRPYGVLDFSRTSLRGVTMQQLARQGIRGLGQIGAFSASQVMDFAKAIGSIVGAQGYRINYQTDLPNYVSPNVAIFVRTSDGSRIVATRVFTTYLPRVTASSIADEILIDIANGVVPTTPYFAIEGAPKIPLESIELTAPIAPAISYPTVAPSVNIIAESTKVSTQPTAPSQVVIEVKPSMETVGIPVNNIVSNTTPIQTAAEYDPFTLQQGVQPRIVDTVGGDVDMGLYEPWYTKLGYFTDILTGSYIAGIPNWMLGIGGLVAYKMFSKK